VNRFYCRGLLPILASVALVVGAPAPGGATWDEGSVPFVPTPPEVVERMLRLAEVGAGDTLLDLGSGDGRVVIAAARRGARALGIEHDASLVARARAAAREAGVDGLARFAHGDLYAAPLDGYTVITLYLLPEANLRLKPRLLALAPGTRIVSHDWDMGPWPPDETLELRVPEKAVGRDGRARVHLWIVPAEVHGSWRSLLPAHGGQWRFDFEQQYQRLEARVHAADSELLVRAVGLRGDALVVVATGLVGGRAWHHRFHGKVSGHRIAGELVVSDGERRIVYPWTATRR